MENIYLDNNATTPLLPEVHSEAKEALDIFGNPSSPHHSGREARKKIEESREITAGFINANPNEIIFTSGGTESIVSSFYSAKLTGGNNSVISTAVEHSATLEAIRNYENLGWKSCLVGVDENGVLDLADLKEKLKKNPGAFVSVIYVNNETGVIFPVDKICDMAKQYGALVHVDAVQAAGKIPLDAKKINCDYLSLSAHKFHGLKGCGVLYMKKGVSFHPSIPGHQENKRRGGTENVLGIISLGAAIKGIQSSFSQDMMHMKELRDLFENRVLKNIQSSFVNGQKADRVCNTTNITFPGKDAALLVDAMSRKGLYASTGAACSTGGAPSHVLRAMGLADKSIASSLRFSISKLTTEHDIEKAVDVTVNIAEKMNLGFYREK